MFCCHEDLNWHYEQINFWLLLDTLSCLLRLAVATLYLSLKKFFSATSPTTRNEIKAKRSGINQVSYYKRGDFDQESNKCRSAASYQKSPCFFFKLFVAASFCETFNESRFLRSSISLEKYFCWFSIHSALRPNVLPEFFMGKLKVAFLRRFWTIYAISLECYLPSFFPFSFAGHSAGWLSRLKVFFVGSPAT